MWQTWQQATCMPDTCFCEHVRTNDYLVQPVNTMSSFAFNLVAVILAQSSSKRIPPYYKTIYLLALHLYIPVYFTIFLVWVLQPHFTTHP